MGAKLFGGVSSLQTGGRAGGRERQPVLVLTTPIPQERRVPKLTASFFVRQITRCLSPGSTQAKETAKQTPDTARVDLQANVPPAPFRPDLSPAGRQHRGQGSFHRLARKPGLWAPFSKGPQWKNSSSPPALEARHRRYKRPVRTQTQAGIQRAQWRDGSGSRRQGPRTPLKGPRARHEGKTAAATRLPELRAESFWPQGC